MTKPAKHPPYTGRGHGNNQNRNHKAKIHLEWEDVVPAYRDWRNTTLLAQDLQTSAETIRRALKFWEEPRRKRGAGGLKPEDNPFWNGGHTIAVPAHRSMSRKIATYCYGQVLPPQSVIHHVDGVTSNNDPTNLILFRTNSGHLRLHYQLLHLPQPVSVESSIQLALENGGQVLQRPRALNGWLLYRYPPVHEDNPALLLPHPIGYKQGKA